MGASNQTALDPSQVPPLLPAEPTLPLNGSTSGPASSTDVSGRETIVWQGVGIDVTALISEAVLMFVLCVSCLLAMSRLMHREMAVTALALVAATWSLLYVSTAILGLRAAGEYVRHALPSRRAADRSIIYGLLGTACVLAVVSFVSRVRGLEPTAFAVAGAVNVVAVRAWREEKRRRIAAAVRDGRGGRNVIIVGSGVVAEDLAALINRHQSLGYRMVGFVNDQDGSSPRLGGIKDLSDICRTHFVDEILLAHQVSFEQARAIVERARQNRIDVTLVPNIRSYSGTAPALDVLGDYAALPIHREPRSALRVLTKRSLDAIGAAAGLLAASPLLLLVAGLIKLDSPGPVLYRSRRIGKKGRHFSFYKFRTMVCDAERLQDSVRHLNKRQGAFFKIENDPRVTRIGRLLRKYSLDELPQLFNVLIGDMSMVGPRPHTLDDYKHYRPEHLRRLEVLPGITGLWQITARRDPSFDVSMALDLEYIAHWSLRRDLRILWRTIPVVISGAGE